jgi:SAM-dependent methyltransferase
MDNLTYTSDYIVNLFDNYRNKFEDFYPSEKWAFEKLNSFSNSFGAILDVGCATGGLGLALSNNYNVKKYDGIDINKQAIEKANSTIDKYQIPANFECGDILNSDKFSNYYDNVFSLSCADWNIRTLDIINRCWELVKPGGFFTISVRLTNIEGINDFKKSYQVLKFKNTEPEMANYVVFNWKKFLKMIYSIKNKPSEVYGFGYWGEPASNAITPYKQLVFSCFVMKKGTSFSCISPKVRFSFPLDLFL